MLARLVSDTWQTDPNATVFIDRDGERFKYVLDYLRYGKVSLPITVPKDMFLYDMEFYGFVVVNETVAGSNSLDDLSSIIKQAPIVQGISPIFQMIKNNQETIEKCELETLFLEKAMEYAKRYIFEKRSTTYLIVFTYTSDADKKLFNDICKNKDLFERCLAQCGLRLEILSFQGFQLNVI